MEPNKLYQLLEDLAEQKGITIRYDNLSATELNTKSGLCILKGEKIFIMDESADISERIQLLVECLRSMDLEGLYLVPALRNLLRPSHSPPED